MTNITGKGGRLFAEQKPGADPTTFREDNTSDQYYNTAYYKQHKDQVLPVPEPSIDPPRMNLADVLGDSFTQAIQSSKQISFHAVGDTGATQVGHLLDEEAVAHMMAADVEAGGASPPAFLFILGDLIYQFGEAKYYYDQFYDPYRMYDRPIFAIPGNHDGVVYGDTSTTKAPPSLEAFLRNFCASKAGPSPDAGGLMRSTMTQPGVYFTLDAPMVSIIGLYSNVLEGPGVISSQGGHYPTVSDAQLDFLEAELARLRPSRLAGERAVIIAVHHPPLSADAKHGGSTGISTDIDSACQKAGLWPDAILSGHAHLYQRFTRRVANQEIPYVVSGSGGYNAKAHPQGKVPKAPFTNGDITMEIDPVIEYGYLKVTVDMTSAAKLMTIAFNATKWGTSMKPVRNVDHVTVDLVKHQIVKTQRSVKSAVKKKPSSSSRQRRRG
jgi:hypothetical protein